MRDLSLHLMDIVQNSVKAKASVITIRIEVLPSDDQLVFVITDNGCGMSEEMSQAVQDPFVTSRTTRSVGLGIPLLKELCELTGGSLQLRSGVGQGTRLTATLGLHSIDRLPIGEIGDTLYVLVSADPNLDYKLNLVSPSHEFELDLAEVRRELDGVPLDEPDVLNWLRATIREEQQAVFSGFLDEIRTSA